MPHLMHLRVGGFLEAVPQVEPAEPVEPKDRAGRPSWRRALTRASGVAASLELTARLDELAHRYCAAVEWRTASDAWLDLDTGRRHQSPWALADALYAEAKALLPVNIACGVASTKRAARAASRLAAPNGLVVTRPGQDDAIVTAAQRVSEGRRPVRMVTDPRDTAPFHPALVPRAIARGLDTPADADWLTATDALAHDAARALADLDLVAATIRLQWIPAGRARVADAFVTLPAPTAQTPRVLEHTRLMLRRLRAVSSADHGAGRLVLFLSQLSAGSAQAALPLAARRRFA